MKNKKINLIVALALIGLIGLSTIVNGSTITSVLYFGAFALGLFLLTRFLKTTKVKNQIQKFSEEQDDKAISLAKCEEKAKEWADDNWYQESKGQNLSFSWDRSRSDYEEVYSPRRNEWYVVRYLYTTHGPKNQNTYVFLDATKGEVITSMPAKDVNDHDPLKSLQMVRNTRRYYPSLMRQDAGQDGMDINFDIGNSANHSKIEEDGSGN